MINFHKYAFLDCRKLANHFKGDDYWLCQYNPIWLFIWKDLYKPEISFTNDYIYIRYLMPNIGMCYYPPIVLGKGDLKKAYMNIYEDAKTNGFDFYMAPVPYERKNEIEKLGEKLYENRDFESYIYSSEALSFFKGKEYKQKRNQCMKFEKQHPYAVYKKIKKEDFAQILEFITTWNSEHKEQYNTPYFYQQLNVIKMCMDHLYEFNLHGIMLYDEEMIYGVCISSIVNNVATIHVNLALSSIPGAEEELIQCFARTVTLNARYICLENDMGDQEIRKENTSYKPLKLEKYFGTFNL